MSDIGRVEPPGTATGLSAASPRRGEEETRQALLDAAEMLFGRLGFRAVGTRTVTARAGRRLASVNDLFGSKDALLTEVLMRRGRPLHRARYARLAANIPDLDSPGPDQDREDRSDLAVVESRVGKVVEAYVEPSRERVLADPGWCHYFSLVSQLLHSADPVQLRVAQEYNDLSRKFTRAFRWAAPAAPVGAERDAYLFMLATVTDVFSALPESSELDEFAAQRRRTETLPQRATRTLSFLRAGLVAVLTDPRDSWEATRA